MKKQTLKEEVSRIKNMMGKLINESAPATINNFTKEQRIEFEAITEVSKDYFDAKRKIFKFAKEKYGIEEYKVDSVADYYADMYFGSSEYGNFDDSDDREDSEDYPLTSNQQSFIDRSDYANSRPDWDDTRKSEFKSGA